MVLTKHQKPRFVLMSYEYYEQMRTGGDPRSVHRASEMPEEHRELFAAEIDRLARPRGMTMSREFLPGQVIAYPYLWAWQHERGE
ncbi:type II toxin-antitoxin system Phd/YefM family antitoxin [Sinorhizobium meliloti]|uniref:type II toxin-antitoxin system Phd/YefM family antitoxin n=1 Tax=Rhizobium meliloti TaxID=382 RepID=UPI000FDAFFCD|nr:type II toxin-antitoxin system Phd/YefM family antitoxin [Sinorhizobium meliloti]MDW9378335.1 type II toxin-antitoxin system Phd/YefM family antitoxin [Sinorhizobium meliloti]MDW9496684.1 type II toxin-antitoxin system Phd/YefM family antitoxin [Sinorhizobium meliloti]MDW9509007.1 type II toxin-antitoxin system Phd/YefM family antitoxin [Sinorhizobium meliloti]MDW9565267.1 type II toxin-antitoxin system Phd/YefM family antitoxin [Sinorhizobium meliloti]MDW9652653.1 type II toxin-antitoxin s